MVIYINIFWIRYLLEPFMSLERKRLTHTPKIIFMDTGIAFFSRMGKCEGVTVKFECGSLFSNFYY